MVINPPAWDIIFTWHPNKMALDSISGFVRNSSSLLVKAESRHWCVLKSCCPPWWVLAVSLAISLSLELSPTSSPSNLRNPSLHKPANKLHTSGPPLSLSFSLSPTGLTFAWDSPWGPLWGRRLLYKLQGRLSRGSWGCPRDQVTAGWPQVSRPHWGCAHRPRGKLWPQSSHRLD